MNQQAKLQNQLIPVMAVLQAQMHQQLITQMPTSLALRQQCTEVHRLADAYGLPVHYAFQMPTFPGYRLYRGNTYDWVVTNADEHPLVQHPDKFPVPQDVLVNLQKINQVMDFDAIYIADEVEKGVIVPGTPLTADQLKPPPSRHLLEEAQRLGNSSQTWWQVLTSPWLLMAGLATMATLAVPVVVGLDPIIFGLRTAGGDVRTGTPAAWFYLGHWAWNQE